jgi:chemotaxis family two-component system response regulator Rcp1
LRLIRVLLVEDSPGDVVLIREALRTSPFAIKLSVAYDGEEALRYLRAEWFDLVILDLNLPRADGHTILRKQGGEASPSIVVFSSSDSLDDREQALAAGAMEYVVKPSGLDDFVHAIQHMVERWGCGVGTRPVW